MSYFVCYLEFLYNIFFFTLLLTGFGKFILTPGQISEQHMEVVHVYSHTSHKQEASSCEEKYAIQKKKRKKNLIGLLWQTSASANNFTSFEWASLSLPLPTDLGNKISETFRLASQVDMEPHRTSKRYNPEHRLWFAGMQHEENSQAVENVRMLAHKHSDSH